ncbi:hypothetical protein FCJ59_18500 [Cupriavidus basilensis]|nr:hypothetical protein [Cupriavidus basilensis]
MTWTAPWMPATAAAPRRGAQGLRLTRGYTAYKPCVSAPCPARIKEAKAATSGAAPTSHAAAHDPTRKRRTPCRTAKPRCSRP